MKKNAHITITKPARVIHIDDDPAFLLCVKDTLEQNRTIEVLRSYEKASAFLSDLPNIPPFDAVIIDHVMKEKNGRDVLKKIRDHHLHLPIISFSNRDDPEYIQELKKAGIPFWLPKSELSSLGSLVLEAILAGNETKGLVLNEDDRRLLLMCCNNLSREEMSEKLFIGKDAVKARKQHLAGKLDIENENINFLKWGIQNGYFKL